MDPGSRVCGYGVVDVAADRSCRYVECGVLTAAADQPMEHRLGEIARWLTDVITELRPTEMAVEDVFARVNLRTALEGGTTARCSVTLTAPQARDAVILLGFDEIVRLELNGEEVFVGQSRIAVADEFRIPVALRQGENRLVVETSNRRLAWGFFLRFADAAGNPIEDLVVQAGGR